MYFSITVSQVGHQSLSCLDLTKSLVMIRCIDCQCHSGVWFLIFNVKLQTHNTTEKFCNAYHSFNSFRLRANFLEIWSNLFLNVIVVIFATYKELPSIWFVRLFSCLLFCFSSVKNVSKVIFCDHISIKEEEITVLLALE